MQLDAIQVNKIFSHCLQAPCWNMAKKLYGIRLGITFVVTNYDGCKYFLNLY